MHCEYVRRYGACTTACERFNVSCPWAKKRSSRDHVSDAVITVAILTGLVLVMVL
jgi:hypothetical protein